MGVFNVCCWRSMYTCVSFRVHACVGLRIDVYTRIYVHMWVYTCVYARVACMCGYVYGVCLCVFISWVACCSGPDSLSETQTHYRRFGFVLVVDPVDWRFENRSMG